MPPSSIAERAPASIAVAPASPPSRIPSLDGLRAISISLVILFHMLGDKAAGGRLGGLGNFGVRIFFVISGFLITRLLLDELEKTNRIDLAAFYLRRTRRIFPAAYTYLLVLLLLSLSGVITLGMADLARAATYVSNYFPGNTQSIYVRHFWSLAVEEQFYLLWPPVLWFFGRKGGVRVATAVALAAPLIRLAYFFYLPSMRDVLDRRFECVADALAMGCLLACARPWLEENRAYRWLVFHRFFPLALLFAPLLALSAPAHPRINYGIAQTLVNVVIAMCIHRWTAGPDGFFGRFLNQRWVAGVGVMSYSLYVWQQPFLDPSSTSALARFPLNLLAAAAVAYASFRLVERAFQKRRVIAASDARSDARLVLIPPTLH